MSVHPLTDTMHLNTPGKQSCATGRSRIAAIQLLAPRIFGAIEHHSIPVPASKRRSMEWVAERDAFRIDCIPRSHDVLFGVWWHGQAVMKGFIDLREQGNFFNGRLKVHTWQRGRQIGHWQHELISAFEQESVSILHVPLSQVPEEMSRMLRISIAQVHDLFLNGPLDKLGATEEQFWYALCEGCHKGAANGIALDQIGVTAIELGLAILSKQHSPHALSEALQRWAVHVGKEQLDLIHATSVMSRSSLQCTHDGVCTLGQLPFSQTYRRPRGFKQMLAVSHVGALSPPD